ncbi:hypothetical protein Syun_026084 [Stephania yunnanensis]|uniref:Beta-glucosidase n=1 Tax=Stephania yunnanensis TaxID=152371 RepID=A0AAP0F1R3_9MAGN
MGCLKRDFVAWALLVSVALLNLANQGSGIDRRSFPDGFQFGFSSSAYQMEGAAHEDGRGLSIWDTFCAIPGKILNGDTGDIAVDMYHHYKRQICDKPLSLNNNRNGSVADRSPVRKDVSVANLLLFSNRHNLSLIFLVSKDVFCRNYVSVQRHTTFVVDCAQSAKTLSVTTLLLFSDRRCLSLSLVTN